MYFYMFWLTRNRESGHETRDLERCHPVTIGRLDIEVDVAPVDVVQVVGAAGSQAQKSAIVSE